MNYLKTTIILLLLLCFSTLVVADKNVSKEESQAVPKQGKEEGIKWTSYDVGLERAKKEEKHVFIDFTTSWCKWCKKMDKETFSLPEVVELVNDHFVAVKVDGDSKNQLDIDGFKITEKNLAAKEFGVRGYPTFWFLKPDGSKLGSVSGYQPTKTMMDYLAYVKDYKYDTTRTQTPGEDKN